MAGLPLIDGGFVATGCVIGFTLGMGLHGNLEPWLGGLVFVFILIWLVDVIKLKREISDLEDKIADLNFQVYKAQIDYLTERKAKEALQAKVKSELPSPGAGLTLWDHLKGETGVSPSHGVGEHRRVAGTSEDDVGAPSSEG